MFSVQRENGTIRVVVLERDFVLDYDGIIDALNDKNDGLIYEKIALGEEIERLGAMLDDVDEEKRALERALYEISGKDKKNRRKIARRALEALWE